MNQAGSSQAVTQPPDGEGAGPSAGARGLRAAHVRDTRRALLTAARELFAADGFQATRTEEIVRRAGLTRGALYHHFLDKEDLFRAVYEEVTGEVTRSLRRRSQDRHRGAWDLFVANSEVYLEAASTNPAYRQIVLVDGPAVLGWNSLSERGDGPTHQIMGYLREAVAEGALDPQPLEPLAHLLSALGTGAALYVAHAADPEAARREVAACNERFLAGLGVRPTSGHGSTDRARPGPPSEANYARRTNRKDPPMAWDFSTEPEFQEKLDWARQFVADKVEPLDILYPHKQFHPLDDELRPIVDPMKQEVRDHDLWAAHLGPELGGKGYGQVKLALLNEILGVSSWAPIVFGTQAPDTGNAEIIAHYGTDEQKEKYLQPLLDGEVFSCYSMTEPQAGSDPQQFTCAAVQDGDEWVINGWKFFSSNARTASFLIVMAVTDPDVSIYQGASMFLVPTDTPGVNMTRHVGLAGESDDEAMHALIHYEDVRVPAENLLGGAGQAFAIAQTRLGGGRVHHAMRTVATCQRALDLLCERVLSRETQGSLLARKQFIQGDIADSYAELQQFRLLVLYTAWEIDQIGDYRRTRKNIAAIKALTPKVAHDAVWRSMHAHGALGVSNEMPFGSMWMMAPIMSVVDGPTEVHKVTVAREVLKDYEPSPGLWPTAHLPAKREEAQRKLAAHIEHLVGNS